jgi:16S rRNA (cytosine967-C5)-methyltransferase
MGLLRAATGCYGLHTGCKYGLIGGCKRTVIRTCHTAVPPAGTISDLPRYLTFMPATDLPLRAGAQLAEILLSSARVTEAVLGGQSMTQAIAQQPADTRAATQALSFHAMRELGWARAVKEALIERAPSNKLLDALAIVSIALLKTDQRQAKGQSSEGPASAMPSYAPYTIVDQTVNAAASLPELANYKGLLNGSLRRFLRERDAVQSYVSRNTEAEWNHPYWWVELLKNAYPHKWEAMLASAQTPAPLVLRVNRRRATREQVMAAFEAADIACEPSGPMGIALVAARPVRQLPGFDEGWWSVQDAGAQMAAPLLSLTDGMRVLDACAAPGGKSAHMLEMADIELLALDSDEARLPRITENLDRLGLMNDRVTIRAADAGDLDSWWDGRPFDAVLADVPCTASGIVRRHPDIRWLRRLDDLARTAQVQAKMVDTLWRTVAVGGHLLYVTCSVFPGEGARQASAFARRHTDAKRLPAPGQLLPTDTGTPPGKHHDGFFYALFAKQS